jgi:D-erythronate 2-dehydrogenase
VNEAVRHWHASPRSAIGFLTHAAALESELIGPRRNFNMPGLSVTVEEQLAALKSVAGTGVIARIKREPDGTIAGIVSNWPQNFDARRAIALGFTAAEKTFADIIRIHIDDELHGAFVH